MSLKGDLHMNQPGRPRMMRSDETLRENSLTRELYVKAFIGTLVSRRQG